MKNTLQITFLTVLAALLPVSCTTQRKLGRVRDGNMSAQLAMPSRPEAVPAELSTAIFGGDTLMVKDAEGKDVYIMKAVLDSASGQMVATDVLQAAVIVARFRNVAERHGKVNIGFEVQVPKQMLDERWQMRLSPTMYILEDTASLEKILITGESYRRGQLRGYERYERFLNTIIRDTSRFIDLAKLETFIQRNIPQLYAFRRDSSFVTEEQFTSAFGVTEADAVEHYTDKLARWLNNRRKGNKARMYAKYVKVPIDGDKIRIDTVLHGIPEVFAYEYLETVATRPRLRRVDVVLEGGIWEEDKELYHMPASEPLTFYISSLTSFVDGRPRYLDSVIMRRAESNSSYELLFSPGSAEMDAGLGENAEEIASIRQRLVALMDDEIFDLDSIVVTASASPEGSWRLNERLSKARSRSICDYFGKFVKSYQDSCRLVARRAERSRIVFNLDETFQDGPSRQVPREIPFISRNIAENWSALDRLVETDSTLSPAQKRFYFDCNTDTDMDGREERLKSSGDLYRQIKSRHYPACRNVLFCFNLHRKEMIKDTIHTTVPDLRYAEAVQMLRDHDYVNALAILSEYQDYNTAVAYSLLDRNASALALLKDMPETAEVNYLMAIIASRQGRVQDAVEHYVSACRQNPSYRHRGNLDPEIYPLVKAYSLDKLFVEEEIL